MAGNTQASAIRLNEGFGVDKLSLDEVSVREPGTSDILVRMHAVSLNYREVLVATGLYGAKQQYPITLGSDGAGEVVAIGSSVTRYKIGDRVVSTFFQHWESGEATEESHRSALGGAVDGVFTTHKLFRENGLVRIPENLSFEEASTLPCAAVTAWNALFVKAAIKAGDTILVLGTGGVSIFALQLGRLAGAQVIVTSSSDQKLERARALGATHTINYNTTPDWHQEVRRVTHGRGVDVVVEVGGAGTFRKSLKSIRIGGHVAVIGNLSGFDAELSLPDAIGRQANIHGIYVGSRTMFEDMNRAIALHRMQPVIDRVYEFAEWRQAIQDLKKGEHFGKLVIRMADAPRPA